MNGDAEALTEKLWDAITEIRDDFPRSHRDAPTALLIDAAVLPILRAAQADAWDEGQASGWDSAREESDQHGGVCDMWKPHVWLTPNPYREQED